MVSFLNFLVNLLTKAPQVGVYEVIDADDVATRNHRGTTIQVYEVSNGWVRYNLVPGVFAGRSMRIAAFNISFRRVENT